MANASRQQRSKPRAYAGISGISEIAQERRVRFHCCTFVYHNPHSHPDSCSQIVSVNPALTGFPLSVGLFAICPRSFRSSLADCDPLAFPQLIIMSSLHAVGSSRAVSAGIQYGSKCDASFLAVCPDNRIVNADGEIAQAPIKLQEQTMIRRGSMWRPGGVSAWRRDF